MKTPHHPRKVVIIGSGMVGSTFAYALAMRGVADEIVLTDKNQKLAEANVQDLSHGMPFFPPVRITSGDQQDYADAHVIVITAGAKQEQGETRLDLLQRNAKIMERIIDDVVGQESEAVVVVVSNPVDILTQVALERSGWPRERILGSGTVLDSARFKYMMSKKCGADIRNVHAYILGEHGDSEFAAWSMTHIGGLQIDDYCPICGKCADYTKVRKEIEERVRRSAYHIIEYKGATYYAVGLALVRIVEAILRNEHSVLTVSTLLQGEYGLEDVCLSVPCMLGKNGIELILEGTLAENEREALSNSGNVLKGAYRELREQD